MDLINKLPVAISLAAAIIIGLAGRSYVTDLGKLSAIMTICMVVFYIMGLILRSTIREVCRQIQEAENQRLAEEMKQKQEEQIRIQEEQIKKQQEQIKKQQEQKKLTIDYSVGEDDQEFIPLEFEKQGVTSKD